MTDSDCLIVDTNILVRCVVGRAMRYVEALARQRVVLLTTNRNVDELIGRLTAKFGLSLELAISRAIVVLGSFDLLDPNIYAEHQPEADRRLREGGKSDWPALAAALSLDCAIWTDDTDFFGTGVPVWSTANVLLCAADNKD